MHRSEHLQSHSHRPGSLRSGEYGHTHLCPHSYSWVCFYVLKPAAQYFLLPVEWADSPVQIYFDPPRLFRECSRQACQSLWFLTHTCRTFSAIIQAPTTWCCSHACPLTLRLAWLFNILQFVWTAQRSKNRRGCARLFVRPAQWLPLVYQVAMGLPLLGFCHLWIQYLFSAKIGYSACGRIADSSKGRQTWLFNPLAMFPANKIWTAL